MSNVTEQPEWQWVEDQDGQYWIFQLGHLEMVSSDESKWAMTALAELENEYPGDLELGCGFVVSPVWTEGYVCMIKAAEGLCLFGKDRADAEQAAQEWLKWNEATAEDYNLDYQECTWMRLDVTYSSDSIKRLKDEIWRIS